MSTHAEGPLGVLVCRKCPTERRALARRAEAVNLRSVHWIGLISGTSADGIDAALVRIGDDVTRLELLSSHTEPIDEALRIRIHEAGEGAVTLRDLLRLDRELGERFAEAAEQVARAAGVATTDVEGIGSHGQTVAHFPEPEVGGSLQLGAPSVIHERTGIPVVADFRSADIAAGGEGAPLTPFFHQVYFSRDQERRAVLNIGGFTNVTYLPGRCQDGLVAFDPGPGNALLDRVVRQATGGRERFDRDGVRARDGQVLDGVVEQLLEEPYLAARPPKSTGHERFGREFLESAAELVRAAGGGVDDLLATLAAFTIEAVVRSADQFFSGPVDRWIVYGGGVHNPALLEGLRRRVAPRPVDLSDVHGIPVDALEAIVFAVLGWASSRGVPANVPRATGARHAAVLGAVIPPGAFGAASELDP